MVAVLALKPDGQAAAIVPIDAGQAATGERAQLLLATWLSPGFPVGAFSYSNGLETAIADGRIADAAALEDWVRLLVDNGSGWCDAVLLAEAWRATDERDEARLAAAAELAAAMAPSRERRMETLDLGAAFVKAVLAGWPSDLRQRLAGTGDPLAYPVVVGAASAAHGIPLAPTLAQFLNAFAANLISVAVRLVPLGQTEGIGALSRLQPAILTAGERASVSTLDDLGSAALSSDIASMRHETLYSRVFRS